MQPLPAGSLCVPLPPDSTITPNLGQECETTLSAVVRADDILLMSQSCLHSGAPIGTHHVRGETFYSGYLFRNVWQGGMGVVHMYSLCVYIIMNNAIHSTI